MWRTHEEKKVFSGKKISDLLPCSRSYQIPYTVQKILSGAGVVKAGPIKKITFFAAFLKDFINKKDRLHILEPEARAKSTASVPEPQTDAAQQHFSSSLPSNSRTVHNLSID